MIPKILHYYWAGNAMPENLRANVKTWEKCNPDYEVRLWTREDFKDVPFLQDCDKYDLHGFAVDYVKPYVLYHHGGIYLDVDVEVLRPLDDLLDNKCFAGWEHENYNPPFLGTAIIGAEKRNEAIKAILDYYAGRSLMDNGKIIAPSNYIYNDILSKYDIKIYDQHTLYPSDVNTEGSYTIHRSAASWVRRYDEIKSNHLLTACICFRNEGEEIGETVRSVMETTQHTRVLLVDDCSDDGYDYRAVADRWGCDYKRMDKRCGSVGTKDWAGRNAASEYFVLLDGHMRFYDMDWDLKLVRLLDNNPKSIISSRTVYRSVKDGKVVEDGVLRSFCAYVRFDDGYDFDPKWTDKVLNFNDEEKTSDVACVLGACYATSKSWWSFIGGLSGLTTYGLEESLMSIKTWLLGGCCKVTHDWGVGHLYREHNPNYIDTTVIDANRLALAYLFDANPTLTNCNLYERLGIFGFGAAMNTFADKFGELQEIKKDFENKKIRDINWYKTTINNQVMQ